MGSNLIKAPLLAILYAALYNLVSMLFPFSQTYSEVFLTDVYPGMLYYLMLIVYGLWMSIFLAILFFQGKGRKIGLLLPAGIGLLGYACVLPRLEQIMFGYGGGVMTTGDLWMQTAVTALCTLLLLVLCQMLYRSPEKAENEPPQPTYKIKVLPLIIKCICAPLFLFPILYIVIWYFLGWSADPVRAFYNGGAETADQGFITELFNLLLYRGSMVPFSIMLGALVMLLGIPLLLQLPGKRLMFMALHTMLCLYPAIYWIVPSVAFSMQVGLAQLLRFGVLLLVYGLISGILLHTSLLREEPPPPPEPPAGKGGKAGARKPAGAGAARRR